MFSHNQDLNITMFSLPAATPSCVTLHCIHWLEGVGDNGEGAATLQAGMPWSPGA